MRLGIRPCKLKGFPIKSILINLQIILAHLRYAKVYMDPHAQFCNPLELRLDGAKKSASYIIGALFSSPPYRRVKSAAISNQDNSMVPSSLSYIFLALGKA